MSKFALHDSARRAFAFLEDWGLQPNRAAEYEIEYLNRYVRLELIFEPYSGDVGFYLFPRQKKRESFELSLIARWKGDENADNISGFVVSEQCGLDRAIKALSHMAAKHLYELTTGDAAQLKSLRLYHKAETESWAARIRNDDAVLRADEAWKLQDFQGVINALEPFEHLLTPARSKKLALARKRLSEIGF